MVPVPITRCKRKQRGYNQAESIVKGIQKVVPIPVASHIVERVEFSESQTQLSRIDRMCNVECAFKGSYTAPLSHSHILLVDDVTTTGATLMAVANALQKVTDVRISVLTVGYTH